jgi:hypothetical protein
MVQPVQKGTEHKTQSSSAGNVGVGMRLHGQRLIPQNHFPLGMWTNIPAVCILQSTGVRNRLASRENLLNRKGAKNAKKSKAFGFSTAEASPQMKKQISSLANFASWRFSTFLSSVLCRPSS